LEALRSPLKASNVKINVKSGRDRPLVLTRRVGLVIFQQLALLVVIVDVLVPRVGFEPTLYGF
jgi:hypothetical protein